MSEQTQDIPINTEIKDKTLTQGQTNQLHRFGYYFTITFYKIIKDVVYYKICFGRSENLGTKPIYNGQVFVRFSELWDMNICREKMPRRTSFKNTSTTFICQRLDKLTEWFLYVLESKNKGAELFEKLYKLTK